MSASYLHSQGIWNLWGSPDAWKEEPWKIGVPQFTGLHFTWPLEMIQFWTSRHSCTFLSHETGKESPVLQKLWHPIWRLGAEQRLGLGGLEKGVGERSEALLNIKAMGEKMLCPSCEPGPCPPPSLSPLLYSTSNKSLAHYFPVRPGSIRSIETTTPRAWRPGPG